MCGIYGIVGGSVPPTDADLVSMAGELVHRGPDGNGRAVRGRAGLGCRRLAIIDVAGGTQPLTNEAGNVLTVCNGEIYNHAALRRELEAAGHRFRTRSDAEVIPHLYEEYGVDFVTKLDGMFGLALWDALAERLVLARDRLGEKPVYYATTRAGFLFASEPKALLATGRVDPTPNWTALAGYLRHGYVPGGASAFAAIARLPPGARLVLEGEHVAVDHYWEVAPLLAAAPLECDPRAAARALRTHFERAVGAALASDVPLGVFLSGGIDSTAVAALARIAIGSELDTFALGFDVRGFDERDHAARAARALGTRHHTLTITPDLFLEGTRALAPLLDEPLADPALVPTYLLARYASRTVKVVLVGEGSDELFAGYPSYIGGLLAPRYRRLPEKLRRVLTALAPQLGAPRGNTTLRYLVRRFLEEADVSAIVRHRAWIGCFSADALASIATPGGPLLPPPDPSTPPARTEVDMLLASDLTGYLPDDLLLKVDRATMAASLEGRSPFLDHRLVEFACRLPIELKLHGLTGKLVLRDAVSDLVPRPILRRVKRGLTVPLATWIAGPLLPFVRETLSRLDPRVVRPRSVRTLLESHLERRRDNRREIWALVMLQLWQDAYGTMSRHRIA
ncbi:MAG: asparagine synthase (glutamine-hydrolyzing) [Deltaproteobacteria bacterium]|nr:asparagine synthase (glutamine-hydrolyzing) [Deltaproteobacteria bacterium]